MLYPQCLAHRDSDVTEVWMDEWKEGKMDKWMDGYIEIESRKKRCREDG